MDQQKIGNFIMKLRRKNKLTQSKLASLIFVARETVGKWERGINAPDAHSLVLLSELFNVSINEIIAGEYITDSNREKISTLALNMLSENNKKANNKYKLITIMVVFLVIISFLVYFIFSFNSMRVHLISGENDDYALSRCLIVISKQKSYIQIGSIISKETNTNIVSDKNYRISLYYEINGEENLIFSSIGSDTLYTTLNNRENYSSKDLLTSINNLYLTIEGFNTTSKIKLNAHLDHINNHLFSFISSEEEQVTNIEDIESQSSDDIIGIDSKSSREWKSIGPVEYEIANRKLSLSAICSEKESICRVIFVTTWKYPPKIKSYDIMGVRLSDTLLIDDNYVTTINDNIMPVFNYHSYRGLASVINLTDENIKTITQTFNVEYRGSIYASYQHAIKKVSLKNVKKFNFSSIGYGEVFSWESKKMEDSYDSIPGVKLILKEEK